MSKKQKDIRYTTKYAAIQCSYWPIFCSSYSFAAVFLLSRNFNNKEIGIVLALANIFAVFLQPAIANLADTTKKISLKNLTSALAFAAAALTLVRCFIPNVVVVLAVLLILELTILFSLQPLINALGMRLINKGINLNFGLARGLGSLSFALCSYIVGILVERFGPEAAPVVSTFLFASLIIFVYTFTDERIKNKKSYHDSDSEIATATSMSGKEDYLDENSNVDSSENSNGDSKVSGLKQFAKKYKRFVLLLLAVTFTFCSHTMINNYIIQIVENVGGNTKSMGLAIGIAAMVELPAMIFFTYLIQKVSCSTILRVSFLFFVLKAVVTMLAPSVGVIYWSQLLQAGAYAMFIPGSVYYVNQEIGKTDLVKGQAFMTGAITLGGVAASLLGGWLLDGPGVHAMLIAGTVATILGLLVAFLAIENRKMKVNG